jgi:hypothetical protein
MMIRQGEEDTGRLKKICKSVIVVISKPSCQTAEWGNAILYYLNIIKIGAVTANASIGDDDDDLNLKRLLTVNFVLQ